MTGRHVKHRTRGRKASDAGAFRVDAPVLELDAAQPVLARLGAQCCRFSAVDLVAHVKAVAAVAIDAKRNPRNPFAEPTW